MVWGHGTNSYLHADGARQVTLATTLTHYQTDPAVPHPIDLAKGQFLALALCASTAGTRSATEPPTLVTTIASGFLAACP